MLLDPELAELPPELRWREWMGRVEAAIFASAEPVPREVLSPLIGRACVLDDLIADINRELANRPYELVIVGGGYHHRTRARFAPAVRGAVTLPDRHAAPELSPTEMLVLAAIAYEQPVTRVSLSTSLGREVSRDALARLKRVGLIGNGPRAPLPGAPASYVTTSRFLSTFGLATLHDLPEIEELTEIQDRDDAAVAIGHVPRQTLQPAVWALTDNEDAWEDEEDDDEESESLNKYSEEQ